MDGFPQCLFNNSRISFRRSRDMSSLKKLLIFLSACGFSSLPAKVLAQEEKTIASQWEILDLIEKGGIMMFPIIFCSILMLGIGLERAYTLRRKNIINSDFLKKVRAHWNWKDIQLGLQLCNAYDNSLARILKAGLLRFGGPADVGGAVIPP